MSEKIEELRKVKIQKLEQLKALGINPYPPDSHRTHSTGLALSSFDELSQQKSEVCLVGRIKSIRTHGKLAFFDLEDESGRIQVLLREENLKEQFKLIGLLDLGDFLEAKGLLLLSKTGQKSLEPSEIRLLSKSLLPIPTEHFGIEDQETRLRKRYLDLMLHPEVRELFRKKAIFWKTIRGFLEEHSFLEVQLNVLEPIPGGAEAEPFTTHHNALDRDFYLRISLELPLKKLVVGGYEKVFEIGRIFRNEGISTEHLQDYTQMEFYWAYSEYNALADMLEEMYKQIIANVTGGLRTTYDGKEIDWSAKWPKIKYFEIFKDKTGMDLNSVSDDELREYADNEHIRSEKSQGRGRLIDLIYKKKVRPSLIQPCFLINPPVEIEPLAKKDPKNPKEVQRLQILAGGTEIGKGFSELNDPLDQRLRFEEQMKLREAGDKEAQMLDEDYLEAMEYGMPPMSGFGLSERLFAVIMDKSIRETTFFPLMKQED
ncbi:MAG: lysine--tRNA ligase [Candidatus Doudnabacteria bacterium]|nr:lysine--tRNA ligase [Candidatus Doudnabacteria bacterium]